MKKYLLSAIALLFCSALSFGQATPSPAPPVQHFVVSVSGAGFNSPTGAQPTSIAGTAVQLTANVSVGYNRVSNPSNSAAPTYNLGVVNYSRQLSALLGKKLTGKLSFDASNLVVTFQAGAGRASVNGVKHTAEDGGAFLSIPFNNHTQLQIIGYQVLHGAGTTVLSRNTSQQVSSGFVFTF